MWHLYKRDVVYFKVVHSVIFFSKYTVYYTN